MSTRPEATTKGLQYLDVFLSHASEDRAVVAMPLAKALITLGYTVWISSDEVVAGNDLPFKINEGLRSCRSGIAILSPAYFKKYWTKKELSALTSREEAEDRSLIVPVLHGIERSVLSAEFPLWAPAVSVTWSDNPQETAASIATALGRPTATHPEATTLAAFVFAGGFSRSDLDIGPKHRALIEAVREAVMAQTAIWKLVQASNPAFKSAGSAHRRTAQALMLANAIAGPAAVFHKLTAALDMAASEYGTTLRNLLIAAEASKAVDAQALIGLNETYSGEVARTFNQFADLLTDKRVQTVTFPRRHPKLTAALNGVGDDLGTLSRAFETLVDLCVSELPARVRRILETSA